MTARIVIAAPENRAGNMVVTTGLMKALADSGLRVQGFKIGPDYLAPQYYRWATGRPGRNLDTWLMTPAQVQGVFQRGTLGADVAVIEGVVGGQGGPGGGSEVGSTAYLARLLAAPVVLVIDARGDAQQTVAAVRGFRLFDSTVPLAGVICTHSGDPQQAALLQAAFTAAGIPLLGAICHEPQIARSEARWGMALLGGDGTRPEWVDRAGAAVAAQVDLERLLTLARMDLGRALAQARLQAAGHLGGPPEEDVFAPARAGRYDGLRIGIALDPAFCCYYTDTLELLTHWGVDCLFFSPLWGDELPPELDGLYLGGGFPERHAPELAANQTMRDAIRRRIMLGLPILAEGGGYLYLLDWLADEAGSLYPMAGSVHGVARAEARRPGMAYRTAEPGGIRGHLYHAARVEGHVGGPAWQLYHADGTFDQDDGCRRGNLLASSLHVHHGTDPRVMAHFLMKCLRYQEGR